MTPTIRDARDSDADGLIRLIGGCWAEYPGCVMDVDGEVPELRRIASHFDAKGGRFWVAESAGVVVGSIGIAPVPDTDGVELCKLYVDRRARRQGLGARLVGLVEAAAAARRAAWIELWTDTRFVEAHAMYAALGYARQPETRDLHDLSNTTEFRYLKHPP